MIVDSSALISILRGEPDAEIFAALLEAAPSVTVSAATVLESSIVATPALHARLDDIVASARATVVPFDEEQARVARRAYATYGKKSASPAQLNFGDCMTYALAKTTGESLLFKGDDFTHTDVTPAR